MISFFKTKNHFPENFRTPLEFIKKSFNLCLKNPQFLLLGFFLIIFINQEFRIIFSVLNEINDFFGSVASDTSSLLILQSPQLSDTITLIIGTLKSINKSSLLFLFIITFFTYLTIIAQISLALWPTKIKEKSKKIPLKKLFGYSQKFLLPSVFVYLLLGAIIALFLNIPTFFKEQINIHHYLFNLWAGIYILFALLLGLFFVFISRFSIFFIVIKKEKPLLAIKKSFKFFFQNWFSVIKISLSLLAISIVFILLSFLAFVGTLIPLSLILQIILNIFSSSVFLILVAIFSIIITLISLILLSFWGFFQYLTWVLYFSKTVEKM